MRIWERNMQLCLCKFWTTVSSAELRWAAGSCRVPLWKTGARFGQFLFWCLNCSLSCSFLWRHRPQSVPSKPPDFIFSPTAKPHSCGASQRLFHLTDGEEFIRSFYTLLLLSWIYAVRKDLNICFLFQPLFVLMTALHTVVSVPASFMSSCWISGLLCAPISCANGKIQLLH